MKLYHYTNGTKLSSIEKDGVILASPKKPKLKEKPIAWLSTNSHFEKTANKIIMQGGESKLCNMEETAFYCNGLYRFVFDTALLTNAVQWPLLATQARIPEGIKKRLVKRAKKADVKPSQWYGVLGDIPIADATLEKWTGKFWVSASIQDEIAKEGIRSPKIKTITGVKRLPITDTDWGGV